MILTVTHDDLSANMDTILDGVSEAILVLDGVRRVVLANAVARDLFGKNLEGQDYVRAVRHPDGLACVDDVLAGAPRSSVVLTLTHPLRATYLVTVTGLEVSDPDDAPRAVVSFRDISHVREAEQMRSDFAANVSHELRSPLTSLIGFIETLQGAARDDADAQERILVHMDREAQRMNRLITDLLVLSKVEVDARVRPTTMIDVSTVLEHVIATLAPRARSEDKLIQFERPSTIDRIPGDADQLTQVFQNLIENAIKYGNTGSEVVVKIELAARLSGFNGSVLSVCVRDHGPGISAEHIPRLTERFYRVDSGRSRDKGGTGLGLAIVKHIVGRHRGRLEIESTIGEGSAFTVHLPTTVAVH